MSAELVVASSPRNATDSDGSMIQAWFIGGSLTGKHDTVARTLIKRSKMLLKK